MRVARAYHTATLMSGGKVLVAGNGGDEPDGAELYDPSTNRCSDAADRREHFAVRLNSGQVLALGGLFGTASFSDSADRYDPASDTWSTGGKMGGLRGDLTAALLSDGRVRVVAAQLYDPDAVTP